jgi:hypothetical protein
MSNFQLNFNSATKVISVTLNNEEGIFDLAYLFKKLLDDAGIPNKLEEKEYFKKIEGTVADVWKHPDIVE